MKQRRKIFRWQWRKLEKEKEKSKERGIDINYAERRSMLLKS